MVTDGQVRRLLRELDSGTSLATAARRAGMIDKTARHYRKEHYERGSVMLTSNLPFSQWTAIFKDPMTTAAAINRLVRHSMIVELNVPSYRLETAKHAKSPAEPESAATQ